MFCGNCGKQIDDNVLTCPYCKWVVTVMQDNNSPTVKVSNEKQILMISERVPELTLVQIVTNTNLEMEEAEIAIKKLVDKGIAKESLNSSEEKIYIFNNEAYKHLEENRAEEEKLKEEGGGGWGIIGFIIIVVLIIIVEKTCVG